MKMIEFVLLAVGAVIGALLPAIVVDGFDGDGRLWVVDEYYKTQSSAEDLMVALDKFRSLRVRACCVR